MDKLALHKLSYGLYILTTKVDDTPYGCIINTAFQITATPPRAAISCNRDNFTNNKIKEAGHFAISVLSEDSDPSLISIFGYQSGSDINKFEDLTSVPSETLGLPLFPDSSVATLECTVVDKMEVGTHTVFVGEAIGAAITRPDADEMTYRYYHDVRKGVAPKNAPTYIEPSQTDPATTQEIWKCSICGYVHDGNTPFDELADDWVCPICSATKDLFNKQ